MSQRRDVKEKKNKNTQRDKNKKLSQNIYVANIYVFLSVSNSSLAQLAERAAVNRKVGGSKPPGGDNLFFTF